MNIPSRSYQEARPLLGLRVVDVRTPAEFADDHIPGAINFPLFENDQRAIVGTLYKQESPEAAYEKGLSFVEQRMGGMLGEILGVPVSREEWLPKFRKLVPLVQSLKPEKALTLPLPENAILIHCWRGGMRSCAVIALLRELGHSQVFHLDDGYRGYRTWVRGQLENLNPETPLVMLRGSTGVWSSANELLATGRSWLIPKTQRSRTRSTASLSTAKGIGRLHRQYLLIARIYILR